MIEWRYLRNGRVAHAVDGYPEIRRHSWSVCGLHPFWPGDDWFGTGNQAEYEKVAQLPRCKHCLARGAR